jgi:hypothetical protein
MSFAALLLTLAFAAPGDLVRCVGADGQVRWQDRPCARGERSDRLGDAGSSADPEALRRRIEALRGSAPPPRPRAAPAVGAAPRPNVAISEAALAVCSERFLACAHHDRARMDACIAAIPRCAGGGGACCPAACTTSYARERRGGAAPPDAVYLALLAPEAGGCGAR